EREPEACAARDAGGRARRGASNAFLPRGGEHSRSARDRERTPRGPSRLTPDQRARRENRRRERLVHRRLPGSVQQVEAARPYEAAQRLEVNRVEVRA